jgi:hypothetical protein
VVERLGQHIRLLDSAGLSAVAGSHLPSELPQPHAFRRRSGTIHRDRVGGGLTTDARRIQRFVVDDRDATVRLPSAHAKARVHLVNRTAIVSVEKRKTGRRNFAMLQVCYAPRMNWLHIWSGVHEQGHRASYPGIYLPGACSAGPRASAVLACHAEEWEQRALDEIAFHFRECNTASLPPPRPEQATA